MRDWTGTILTFAMYALFVLGVIVAGLSVLHIFQHNDAVDRYVANCAKAGGHIYQPDNALFCVSADGRWVEVYP